MHPRENPSFYPKKNPRAVPHMNYRQQHRPQRDWPQRQDFRDKFRGQNQRQILERPHQKRRLSRDMQGQGPDPKMKRSFSSPSSASKKDVSPTKETFSPERQFQKHFEENSFSQPIWNNSCVQETTGDPVFLEEGRSPPQKGGRTDNDILEQTNYDNSDDDDPFELHRIEKTKTNKEKNNNL